MKYGERNRKSVREFEHVSWAQKQCDLHIHYSEHDENVCKWKRKTRTVYRKKQLELVKTIHFSSNATEDFLQNFDPRFPLSMYLKVEIIKKIKLEYAKTSWDCF